MKQLPAGLIAAPFTAFHADCRLNLERVPLQARSLSRNGVVGAFVCGTTGEGPSMTRDERCRLVEAWVTAAAGNLKVIVHVGHASAAEARLLAEHAQQTGADAIAAVAPNFFKPQRVDELVEWCAEVAAGAPRLPFYYYHIPSITHVVIPTAEFVAAARARIPTLAGVKFTHEDLGDYAATRAVAGTDYDILFGRDELLLEGLRV
jgi:N-acetylneuraminate lyase